MDMGTQLTDLSQTRTEAQRTDGADHESPEHSNRPSRRQDDVQRRGHSRPGLFMTSFQQPPRQNERKKLTFKIANASPMILKNENWRSIPFPLSLGLAPPDIEEGTGTTESLAWSFSLGFMMAGVSGWRSQERGIIRLLATRDASSDLKA